MISYRTHAAYEKKFGRLRQKGSSENDLGSTFDVEAYLRYQGEKFITRFDANSYITVTKLMDSHDVGRDRGVKSKRWGSWNNQH